MEWLNYHHLFYFWTVMQEGSITAASAKLSLAQSTVSAQLSRFEENLGAKLFRRVGQNIEPTDMGHHVYRYADEIFSRGREMMDFVRGRPAAGPLSLKVGIVDVITRLVARKLLEPAGNLPERVRLICHEGKDKQLLAELALHNLDDSRQGIANARHVQLRCLSGLRSFPTVAYLPGYVVLIATIMSLLLVVVTRYSRSLVPR